MSRFRRFEIVEHVPSHCHKQTIVSKPPRTLIPKTTFFPSYPIAELEFDYPIDLLSPPALFDEFDTIADLIQIDETPFRYSTRRVTRRVGSSDLYLQALSDRVSALELGIDRLAKEEKAAKKKKKLQQQQQQKQLAGRKYTWTAEVKSPENDRKYKWTAEIKGGKGGKKEVEKSYKLTAEIKRKGADGLPSERTYMFKVGRGDESRSESEGEEKEKKKTKKKGDKVKGKGKAVGLGARIVEIEEPSDHGGIVLRQVFAKRVEKRRGKRTELSPQDAAALIQMSFRAYLIRRSQALRGLRELAIAKNKLKEIRSLFNNFSYRRQISRDAEEHQKFSEKIIVLLLTVDAIEGADLMVRGAKKSMVDELEAMLDVVDPQPPGKSLSVRRRTFDMPDGVMNKELAVGVAQVVQMLDQDETNTYEACL